MAVATHTEAKAKEVAEVVDAVVKAQQEVALVVAEASGQAETLARAAQVRGCAGTAGLWVSRGLLGVGRLHAGGCGSRDPKRAPPAPDPQALNSSAETGGWR